MKVLPRTWIWAPLGDVLTERQETPSAAALASGDMRIVGKIRFDSGTIQLRADSKTRTGMIVARPGDLVVSGINAAKGAIAIYDSAAREPIAATIHYGAYVPNPSRVNIRFLWWLLRSQVFREILDTNLPNGIKTELKAARLLPINVPLPPLSEQKRIANRIEELATKIERVKEKRRLASLAGWALHTAFISNCIGTEQVTGCLGDVLLDKPRNGWSARCNNVGLGVPILSLRAVTGFEYRATAFKNTAEPTSPDANYWLQAGNLLITRSNTPELVGHAAIYDGTPSPCIYPDLMMRLVVNEKKADKRFVHRWLMSGPARDYIKRAAKGTSPTMKKISQGIVMALPFPTTLSLDQQRRIVGRLDNFARTINRLKKLQGDTASEIEALMPSILSKAFRGEL